MCREAFTKFDLDGSGAISAYELRETLACAHPALLARSSHIGGLERSGRSLACSHTPLTCLSGAAMGQRLSQEEIFDMVARVDADGSGEIGIHHVLDAISCTGRDALTETSSVRASLLRILGVLESHHVAEGKDGQS